MISVTSGRALICSQLVLHLVFAFGCSAGRDVTREIQAGQTRDEVRAAAGEPDEIIEFTLPYEPFFGPQEGLESILPAGTLVEEWQYRSGGEVIYVWYAGGWEEPREEWTVIDTAAFPADAVY